MHPYQHQLLTSLQRHANAYKKSAFIVEEIGQYLLARLAYLRYPPQKICALGCGQGFDLQQLAQCYSGAEIIGVDFSFSQLQQARKQTPAELCVAEATQLPLPSQYFDLVFSNLLLPALLDYENLWQEVQRILKPGGIFLFSSLGPETLRELKTCFESLGHSDAINAFPDMHDIGDSLVQAGFKDPAIDAEKFELHYTSLKNFLRELKQLGSIKLWEEYPFLYTPKNFWETIEKKYRELFLTVQGKLPVTVEAYYVIAFSPTPMAPVEIPLNSIKRSR